MLFWMSCVAVGVMLLKVIGIDMRFLSYFDIRAWIFGSAVGFSGTLVCMVALWSSLGNSSSVLRFSILAVVPPLLGATLWAVMRYISTQGRRPWAWRLERFDWHWIVWTCLVAGFLTAILLLLRTTGYRLVRTTSTTNTDRDSETV